MENKIRKRYKVAVIVLLLICKHLFAVENDSLQKAIAVKVTPLFKEAQANLLPINYAKKGDSCTVTGVHVDTSGIPWFNVSIRTNPYWSQAKYWQYVADIDTAAFLEGKQSEEDKKRRLRILRQHRDWPRRIIRTVRFGRICLDMNSEQLVASWGDPLQRSNAYTIGIGKHDIWIFESKNDKKAIVLLKNDKIIGWSLKQQ